MKMCLSWAVFGAVLLVFIAQSVSAGWVSVNGPFGGRVNSLSHNEKYVYAGTYGGVYRSGDKGTTWIDATPDCLNAEVYSLTVSDDTIFVGTNNIY